MENNVAKRGFFEWCRTYKGQKFITTILFLLIPLILLIVFTFIPAFDMLIYSFQDRTQFAINDSFVGFDNYKTVFTDSSYLVTFQTSLYYLIGSFFQQAIALLLASILCSKIKLKGLFKGTLFFPYLMNGVAVAIIFKFFFQKGSPPLSGEGTLNSIIEIFGGKSIQWFSSSSDFWDSFRANCCLVFVSIWRYIGFDIIMYIGAIQSISPDLYEAADLDGANPWQRFRYIIFPGIKPIVSLQLILAVKGAISVFEVPYIITKGKGGTSTFVIKTIETAFEYRKLGLASAMGIVLLVIIIIVTLIQQAFFKDDDGTGPKKIKSKR